MRQLPAQAPADPLFPSARCVSSPPHPFRCAVPLLMGCISLSLLGIGCGDTPPNDGFASPSPEPTPTLPPDYSQCANPQPGILVIIADDMGVGGSRCYTVGTDLAPSPNIEALCARGVTFDQVWSQPVCSPTRASALTGKYAYRTGVGEVVDKNNPATLSLDEVILPEALDTYASKPYTNACIGKWHVAEPSYTTHPNESGFTHYAGLMTGAVGSYWSWDKTTDGKTETSTKYVTTENVDDAINFICQQDGPWFLWLAFVSPHDPLHLPPDDLHSYETLSGTEEDIQAQPDLYYRAMIEAMDSEMGRLFYAMGDAFEQSHIFYLGDNGPTRTVSEEPFDPRRSKDTLFQGGIQVPLIYAGPAALDTPHRVEASVHVVDLFPSIVELAGGDPALLAKELALDGISLVPFLENSSSAVQHEWILSELFGTTDEPDSHGKAVRDDRYKLIRWENTEEALFDLDEDPYEDTNLLDRSLDPEANTAYGNLATILDSVWTGG